LATKWRKWSVDEDVPAAVEFRDGGPGVIGAGDALGQSRILRIGQDQGNGRFFKLHHHWPRSMTFSPTRYKAPYGKT